MVAMLRGKRREQQQGPGPLDLPDTFAARLGYERQSILLQVRDALESAMAARQITQAQLAKAMGVTEGRVSQILSGDQNLTIKTLASLAAAVGAHFRIELVPTSPLLDEVEADPVGQGAEAPVYDLAREGRVVAGSTPGPQWPDERV